MQKEKAVTIAVGIFITIAFLTGISSAFASLKWRMAGDSPIMLYCAYIMEHFQKIPYKDFFDMNMPITYFINVLLIKTAGTSNIGFRIFDITWCFLISLFSWIWIKRFNRRAAIFVAVFWPVMYFTHGPAVSMQREYLAILPISVGLAFTVQNKKKWWSFIAIGMSLGFACGVKPQFILIIVPVSFYIFMEEKNKNESLVFQKFISSFFLVLIGFIMVFGLLICWLWSKNALKPFLDIYINYIPLYAQLDKYHHVLSAGCHIMYIAKMAIGGIIRLQWPIVAILTILMWKKEKLTKDSISSFFAVMVSVFILYPCISGQFWRYHWLPLEYVSLVSVSVCAFLLLEQKSKTALKVVSMALVAVFVSIYMLNDASIAYHQNLLILKGETIMNRDTISDQIARFLIGNLKGCEVVQPLDWTGGAVHAMLISGARPATKFIYDFHFYHHVNNKYIKRLRNQFINQLRSVRPRYIVEITKNRSWPSGLGTTRSFPVLRQFIKENYKRERVGDSYIIYSSLKRCHDDK